MNLHDELDNFFKQYLPAVQRLDFNIECADDRAVILSAPLEANYNDKGTAFGGSQYMLALSAAWALAYLNMAACGQRESQFVIAEASIRYLSPITSERFYAMADRENSGNENTAEALNSFTQAAKNSGKSRVNIGANVYSDLPHTNTVRNPLVKSQLKALFSLIS